MLAVMLLLFILGCALWGLFSAAESIALLQYLSDPYLQHVVKFTLQQAALSTLLSVTLAIPVARAMSRRASFRGRTLLLHLASLSFVLPTMVAVLGIVAIHGYNGWINRSIQWLGLGHGIADGYYLYGLTGILIGHLFFNLPLAVRVYLQAISNLPPETWRLAAQLGLNGWQLFRWIEWPLLRSLIPGLAAMIFLLCFTSFAIVLTLGGGPKATTLEVAIYQAIRLDFDFARGISLALLQIILCGLLVLIINRFSRPFSFQPSQSDTTPQLTARSDRDGWWGRSIDLLMLLLFAVFLLSPLVAILVSVTLTALLELLQDSLFWRSLGWSVIIAGSSALLALLWALPLTVLLKDFRLQASLRSASLVETVAVLILAVPPVTLGVGLFTLLRQTTDIFSIGVYLVVLINAMMALPFAFRILAPPLEAVAQRHDRLSEAMGFSRLQCWRLLYLPQLRTPLAYALAVSATLSAGDMGVIALFGTQDLSTLPLLIYRLMGSYQMQQAAVAALVLCCLCALLFWGIERAIRGRHA